MNLEPGGFGAELRELAAERLRAFERRAEPLADRRAAAVALTLVPDDEGRPCFVLTRRASKLRAQDRLDRAAQEGPDMRTPPATDEAEGVQPML